MMALEGSSDAWLVLRARKDDDEAFAELYARYAPGVYGYLSGLMHGEAEDLLQETFLKASRCIASLKEPEKFRPWVYQIARNTTRDYLRAKQRRGHGYSLQTLEETFESELLLTSQESPEGFLERELILQAFAALPLKLRECLLLKVVEGFSKQEIAAIVHLQEQSVTTYLSTARRMFRTEYVALQEGRKPSGEGGDRDEF